MRLSTVFFVEYFVDSIAHPITIEITTSAQINNDCVSLLHTHLQMLMHKEAVWVMCIARKGFAIIKPMFGIQFTSRFEVGH
jgi:hypothetical protein